MVKDNDNVVEILYPNGGVSDLKAYEYMRIHNHKQFPSLYSNNGTPKVVVFYPDGTFTDLNTYVTYYQKAQVKPQPHLDLNKVTSQHKPKAQQARAESAQTKPKRSASTNINSSKKSTVNFGKTVHDQQSQSNFDGSKIIRFPDGSVMKASAPSKPGKKDTKKSKQVDQTVSQDQLNKTKIVKHPDGTYSKIKPKVNVATMPIDDINKATNLLIDSRITNRNLNQYFRNHFSEHYSFINSKSYSGLYSKLDLIRHIRGIIAKQEDKVHKDHFWYYMYHKYITKEQSVIKKVTPYPSDTMFVLSMDGFNNVHEVHEVTRKDLVKINKVLDDFVKAHTLV